MRSQNATRGPIITDGATTFSYAELEDACEVVEAFLAGKSIDRDACLAVPCGNTLPSVVAILSLLSQGRGFALCSADQPFPAFCRYVVRWSTTTGSFPNLASGVAIADGLQLEENPSWAGAEAAYRGRFYTRTSGTSAGAKTVLFSHAKLWANARNCVDRFQLNDQEHVAIPVPVSHMYGLAAGLLPAVLARSSIDIQSDSNVMRYLQRESSFVPTTVYLTPSFCYALTRLPQAHRRYRLTIAAGDRTPPEVFARYEEMHGCLVSLYGSTELGAVAAGSPDDTFELRRHSTGRPMPGVQVTHRTESSEGDSGCSELCFDHPCGGEGYVDERGEVARADDRFREGRLESNDVGRLGDDGYLRVAGRSDHRVKRDGRFVAFSDVEEALLKHPAVETAVVLSDGVTPRGARLTAVCVARGEADIQAIREECKRHLPAYAIPDHITLIDDLPRLESGKPDRAALARYVGANMPR